MRNMKLFIITIILLILYCISLKGQPVVNNPAFDTGVKNFQAPNVSTMQTYGAVPVSLYTGTPDISIPLYYLDAADVTIPIGLSYNINNVKPNTQPGIVGLGWNLFAGGNITRIQKGSPDEFWEERGFLYTGGINFIGGDKWWEKKDNYYDVAIHMLYNNDSSPDEFNFNFLGYRGSFYRDHNGQWKVQSETPFIIKHETINYEQVRSQIAIPAKPFIEQYKLQKRQTFVKFTLVAPDGTEYVFGGINAIDYSIDYFDQTSYNLPTATTWHLVEVKTLKGHNIKFNYLVAPPLTDGNISFTKMSHYNWPASGINVSFQLIMSVLLDNIIVDSEKQVDFEYSNSIEKPFAFKSHDGWDPRYAINLQTYPFAKYAKYEDIQKKVLVKMNVSNNFFYRFYYPSSTAERSKLTSIEKTQKNTNLNLEKYRFKYNQTNLPDYHTGHYDHLGFYNGKDFTSFQTEKFCSTPPTIYDADVYEKARAADTTGQFICAETLESIEYPTGGKSEFVYEPHYVKGSVSIDRQSIIQQNFYPGGLRIKQIKNYADNNTLAEVKSYYYQHNFNPTTKKGASSGILSFTPQYLWILSLQEIKDGWLPEHYAKLYMLTSQSTNPAWYNTQEQLVGYSEVIECNEDTKGNINGYTKYTYSNFDTDIHGNRHFDEIALSMANDPRTVTRYQGLGYDYIKRKEYTTGKEDWLEMLPLTPYTIYTPFSSRSQERGKLTSKLIYDNSDKLKMEELYFYNQSSNNYVRSMALTITPNPNGPGALQGINQYILGGAYKIYTYSYNLSSKVIKTYENDKSTILNTEYKYNKNNQIIRETITDKISTYETKTKYLGDLMDEYSNITTNPIPDNSEIKVYDIMKNIYMSSSPIERIVSKNNQIISAEIMTYKYSGDKVLYDKQYKLESKAPLTDYLSFKLSSPYEYSKDSRSVLVSEYINHDSYGNPVEIENKSNKEIYLWSYKGKYLVAKIQNATYKEITDNLGVSVNVLSESATPDLYLDRINSLRDKLPKASIEIYKYKPYIGVIESTDARGITTYYEYDEMGRLIEVYIKENNVKKIINHYLYNYKNK